MLGIKTLARCYRTGPDKVASKSPYFVLAVVCSAMFLDLCNLSAITIALPTIRTDFDVAVGDLQWVISAYALTFGGLLLLGGRGGDIFGHRRVLIFGICFFALFTLGCALAPTFIGLVIARAFQGIGAAFTIPSAQAHIALYFSQSAQKAKALGIWGASGSLGFILGLILGGFLTDYLGWRWIFWISLILSSLVLVAAIFMLPRPAPSSPESLTTAPNDSETGPPQSQIPKRLLHRSRERLVRFDIFGISLGIPGILLLTYSLTSANTSGWSSAQILAPLIISIFLLAAFIIYEQRTAQAILAPHLFRSTSFNLSLGLAVITYAIRQASTYFLTLQLQSYGASPIHTSLLYLPLGISALITNTTVGHLVPIFGARAMFIIGWTLTLPGTLLFSFITPTSSYWAFTFPGLILYIAGIGSVYITANIVVVSSASRSDQGAVAGVFNVALQVGGSVLGLAVLTALAQEIGGRDAQEGGLELVGFRTVYWACGALCGIGLLVSLFAVEAPEGLRGRIWKRDEEEAVVVGGGEVQVEGSVELVGGPGVQGK